MNQFLDISGAVGAAPVNTGAVSSALAAALLMNGASRPSGVRFDSEGNVDISGSALDEWHRHADERFVASVKSEIRGDALPAGIGGFPRDFEHTRQRVLEQKMQPLNFSRLFPTAGDVPLGATSYTVRREVYSGKADFHRGGSDVPVARARRVEESFNVRYIVCGIQTNYFEALSGGFAGLNQYAADLKAARRAMAEKLNSTCWSGAKAQGLYGLLDYPDLAKMSMSVEHTPAVAQSNPKAIAADLLNLISRPHIDSGTIFQPNKVVCSPRLRRLYAETKYDPTSTDTTILQWVLNAQPPGAPVEFEVAQELADAGGTGIDGIFAYSDYEDAIAHTLVQAPVPLPVFQSGPFEQMTVLFAATGGVAMHDVGAHILGLAVAR